MRREDLNTHTSPVVVHVDVFLFIFLRVHLSKSREMDAGFFFKSIPYIRECKYVRPKRLNDSVGGFFFSTTLWLKLWTRPFYPCHYIGMGKDKGLFPQSLQQAITLSISG